MKAMVLRNARPVDENPLQAAEIPVPEPGSEEVQIRISICGLCHTDLHTVEGEIPLPKLPVIPGHQIVGVVESAGKNVTRFKEGDRVGVPWLNSTCRECFFCKRGNENLCESARFTGYHVDGGYAQYTVVSQDFAYHLPAGFSDVEAAPLLCAGVIGFRALRLSRIAEGERLGLYGFGASAHICIQIARRWGCEVYVFTRSQEHRELAQKLGAAWTGSAQDAPPGKLDSAIIFAPAGPLVLDALRALRKGGTVALAGIYMSPIPEMDYSLIYGERVLRSIANSTREDAEGLLRVAAEIPVRTEVELFPLEQANKALQLLKQSKIRGAGALEIPAV